MNKECECYEEEVQPYWKTDYKPIIYIQQTHWEIQQNIYLTIACTFLKSNKNLITHKSAAIIGNISSTDLSIKTSSLQIIWA